MENPKNQLATKLKEANNVLITVSTNPSVDQLAAAIGLTLFLTKLKKHATTVFSGQVPSTIDFLKPEETIENNTDSLRDFIISLDKGKADKIRYKVEDTMVKIFITPYRTSIGEQDLVFSQGDFNVDVVVALGIHNRDDLDQAITAHGRILHDAAVVTVNTKEGSELGTLNWVDPQASSLCEMTVTLTDLLKTNALDGQMATAFLAGIVAETERFSNEKTSSNTMNASAKLMAAGANQQLVATKLEILEGDQLVTDKPSQELKGNDAEDTPKDVHVDDDGALRIDHESSIPETDEPKQATTTPTPPPMPPSSPSDMLPEPMLPEPQEPPKPVNQVKIDDQGELQVEEPHIKQDHRHLLDAPSKAPGNDDLFGLSPSEDQPVDREDIPAGSKLVTEPPQFGGQLSAAADDSSNETSPLNLPSVNTPLLSHDSAAPARDAPQAPASPPPTIPPAVSAPEPPPEPAPEPPPSLPPNLPQAAEPPSPTLPAPMPPPQPASQVPLADDTTTRVPEPSGQPFASLGVGMTTKTLDDIEHKVDSSHLEKPPKLPEPFVKSLDSSTLSGIEQRISSPHLQAAPPASLADELADEPPIDYHKVATEQVAKAMSGTTLDDIEHKVDSPHTEQAAAQVLDTPKQVEEPQLGYEPHESEPPDVSGDPVDDLGVADDSVAVASTDDPLDSDDQVDTKADADSSANSDANSASGDAGSPPQAKDQEESKDDEVKSVPPANTNSSDDDDDKKSPADEASVDVADEKDKAPTKEEVAAQAEDAARDAVLQAINAGGDGRSSLPPLDAIGTSGMVGVGHDDSTVTEETPPPPTPPPVPAEPPHLASSPNIHIDSEGNVTPQTLVPSRDELPPDATAAPVGEASAPPVPPPMMPPVSTPAENTSQQS